MRRSAALLLLLSLVAGAALVLLVARTGDPGGGASSRSEPDPAPDPAAAGGAQGTAPAATTAPERATLPAAGGDPPPRRFRYRLLDARTAAPLGGASLRALEGGDELATTDATGSAVLIGRDVADVVFSAPDYLLEFFALGSQELARLLERSPPGDYEIRLLRDDYTLPLHLHFVRSGGVEPASVQLRLRCVEPLPPEGDELPALLLAQRPASAPIVAAWHRHTLAAMLWGLAARPFYHLGAASNHVVFRGGADIGIRFAVGGDYELEAVSGDGEVANVRVHVRVGSPGPVRVLLSPASALTGEVVSGGVPIAGASVRTEPPALGSEAVTTDAAGRFRLAPLRRVPLTLIVEHQRFAPRTVDALPGGEALRIELQARPLRRLEGRVGLRGRGTPVAGARVSARDNGRVDGESTTTADGRFSIETTFERPELWVVADGFLAYAEVLDPGINHVECELLPASIDARVAAGLSAAITGIVQDAEGRPCPGATVRLAADGPAAWGGLPGRRILQGGLLRPQHVAVTDAAGRFALECTAAGAVRITVVDDGAGGADGPGLTVRLGSRHDDLVLRASH